jgi:hypothetical protein
MVLPESLTPRRTAWSQTRQSWHGESPNCFKLGALPTSVLQQMQIPRLNLNRVPTRQAPRVDNDCKMVYGTSTSSRTAWQLCCEAQVHRLISRPKLQAQSYRNLSSLPLCLSKGPMHNASRDGPHLMRASVPVLRYILTRFLDLAFQISNPSQP